MVLRFFDRSESYILKTLLLILGFSLVLYLITGLTVVIVVGCLPGIALYVVSVYRYMHSIYDTYL